jgi:hypothetical protein
MSGKGFKVTNAHLAQLASNEQSLAEMGSWGETLNEDFAAGVARSGAMTPAQRAAENATMHFANHPAVRSVKYGLPPRASAAAAAPKPFGIAFGKNPAAAAAAAWKPPQGKVMRECRNSNVGHSHASGAPCKYVHKNENAYGHLRNEQKRPAGGKSSRRGSRKSRQSRQSRRGGGNIKIVPSPAPLSKVDTYTSWPGGIDPTVPLYNQRTMLGGWCGARRNTRRNTMRRRS